MENFEVTLHVANDFQTFFKRGRFSRLICLKRFRLRNFGFLIALWLLPFVSGGRDAPIYVRHTEERRLSGCGEPDVFAQAVLHARRLCAGGDEVA